MSSRFLAHSIEASLNTIAESVSTSAQEAATDLQAITINTAETAANTLNISNNSNAITNDILPIMDVRLKEIAIPSYQYLNLKSVGELQQFSAYNTIGSSQNLYTTETSACRGMVAGQFLNLPSTASKYSFASTSANDTLLGSGAQRIGIIGWISPNNNMGGAWFQAVELLDMNGTTPVITFNSYIRIYVFGVIQCGTISNSPIIGAANVGTISVIPLGSTTFTAGGVPVDATKITTLIAPGQGINNDGMLSVPPGYQYFYSNVSLANSSTNNQITNVNIYARTWDSPSTTTGWICQSRHIATDNSSNVNSVNEALGGIALPYGQYGTDLITTAYRVGGTANNAVEIIVNGVLVEGFW